MKKSHVLFVILMVGSTAGCTGASSSTPPTDVPEPAPTVTVTANAAPIERSADSPLTALDVYAICKGQTSSFLYLDGSAPSDLVYAAFSDSRIEKIGTTWFTLIGVSGTSADPVNVFCGVSGSIGNPVWD